MKRIRSYALLGATALFAASVAVPPALAGGMKAENRAGTQQHAAVQQQALTAQNFVLYATNADLFQAEASKIAVQRAQSSEVKIYAQQMASQHANATSKLNMAARQAGVTPVTPVLTVHMQQKLAELQNTSTTTFDERYITLLQEAQERELRLHNAYARGGDNATLRAASTDTAQLVAQHLAEARRISTSVLADRPAGS
jgi:putative membrane protein